MQRAERWSTTSTSARAARSCLSMRTIAERASARVRSPCKASGTCRATTARAAERQSDDERRETEERVVEFREGRPGGVELGDARRRLGAHARPLFAAARPQQANGQDRRVRLGRGGATRADRAAPQRAYGEDPRGAVGGGAPGGDAA